MSVSGSTVGIVEDCSQESSRVTQHPCNRVGPVCLRNSKERIEVRIWGTEKLGTVAFPLSDRGSH